MKELNPAARGIVRLVISRGWRREERGESCMARERGICKWFNDSKGYGFISRDREKDVFVHFTAIVGDGHRSLKEGDEVEFEVEDGAKGPQAIRVSKV
jgi:cold shock protein